MVEVQVDYEYTELQGSDQGQSHLSWALVCSVLVLLRQRHSENM